MSGVAIIRSLLIGDSSLTDVVPTTQIYSGPLPVGTRLSGISVMQISALSRLNVAMGATQRVVTERVQITTVAKTYVLQKSIMSLIRAACPNTNGTVNGFACDSILPDAEGIDEFDSELGLYMQTQDFIVKFNR